MSMRTAVLLIVTLSIALAGCTGAPVGTDGTAASPDRGGDDGRVNFYLSDERNAIGDFRHLNVTITSVGFQRGGESGEWIERDVDNRTADLTELRGARATRIDSFDLPNGTYTKVFVHVSEVNGTLNETGEQVEVKLPSEKLQLNQEFTLNGSGEVDFVYDVSVHKAGQSGKYILKPVVSESGTDVPIESIDEDGDDRGERPDDADRGEETDLNVSFVGNVTRGENATVEVTRNGSAVANATVTVDGEAVGTTDGDGRLTFAVPEDVDELTVVVTDGDDEVELEVEFEADGTETDAEGSTETEGDGSTPSETAGQTPTATDESGA